MRRRRVVITDFVEDLNHRLLILYIGDDVDVEHLKKRLEDDVCNKVYRLEGCINDPSSSSRRFFYISNCDFQNLDYPIHEYVVEDGFNVCVLHYDEYSGEYYYDVEFDW